MKFTKKEKQFIELAISYYWDVWNITHPSNNKNKDTSEKILEKLIPAKGKQGIINFENINRQVKDEITRISTTS